MAVMSLLKMSHIRGCNVTRPVGLKKNLYHFYRTPDIIFKMALLAGVQASHLVSGLAQRRSEGAFAKLGPKHG